jgi:hypothetical protein
MPKRQCPGAVPAAPGADRNALIRDERSKNYDGSLSPATSIDGEAVGRFRKSYDRRAKNQGFSLATLRLREVERIIRDRHGIIPETDDADVYIVQAARCLYQIALDRGRPISPQDISAKLSFWCERWAPWQIGWGPELAAKTCSNRRGMGRADRVGKELRLSYADRSRLNIRTIGAYDVDKRARASRSLAKRQKRDRERARATRAAKGALTREEYLAKSLSRTKPWEALGISRRTYERHRKARSQVAG